MEHTAQSIDAIVATPVQDITVTTLQSVSPSSPASPTSDHAPDRPDKLKRRNRLLQGLHRISSSPSLVKMRPSKSNGNLASMSCVSLAGSSMSYSQTLNSSVESEFSQQFSTAPTSVNNSPGPATPTFEFRPRARTFSSRDSPAFASLPHAVRPSSPVPPESIIAEADEDYFSCSEAVPVRYPKRPNFNFWEDLPSELRIQVLGFLTPKEIVKCSLVSKAWHEYCFDGQLWCQLDTAAYYSDISPQALAKIMSNAGPFVRDLNLRGCVQLRDSWHNSDLAKKCKNLENFCIEGCSIDRPAIHSFLLQNPGLVQVNISGLAPATNGALKILGQHCPKLEHLNVTWCQNIDARGILHVIKGCSNLKELRAGEVRGWDNVSVMKEIFERNTLEKLVLSTCSTLTDESLSALMVGVDGQIDYLTGRIICPPRKLKHLDISSCRTVTDEGLKILAHNLPNLEGLALAKCSQITDESLTTILPTLSSLTHLDLEELENIGNETILSIASGPATGSLQSLTVSYCEALTDTGMVPLVRACPNLKRLDLDNTRISDLCLIEAAAQFRTRNRRAVETSKATGRTVVRPTLLMVIYDCPNVTWMGVREIMSCNAESGTLLQAQYPHAIASASYVHETINLKAFYTWQPTINEHAKRINACEWERAKRLERKWAEFMMLGEEAAQGGRRRRRRMREAQEAMEGEEGVGGMQYGVVGRRRARSTPMGTGAGCVVM